MADVKRGPEVYGGCLTKGNTEWYLKHGIASVVTRGAEPPLVSGSPISLNLAPVSCVNHVGAGDCFAAHLVLGLTHGLSLTDAASVAHSAGRVYVKFRHNRPPFPKEIAADMSQIM